MTALWLPLGIRMESLKPFSDPTLVLGGSWFPPVEWESLISCGESIHSIPGGWRNRYHWLALLAWPKCNRTPHIMSYVSVHLSNQVAPRTAQGLSHALVQIWEEMPRYTIHNLLHHFKFSGCLWIQLSVGWSFSFHQTMLHLFILTHYPVE